MWSVPLLHFVVSALIGYALSRVTDHVAGVTSTSLNIGPLLIGLVCASTSLYISPWLTPVILLLYLLSLINDSRRE